MDINRTLEQAPSKIAELADKCEDSRFIFKAAEIQQSQLEARKHLEFKAEGKAPTQSDLKAMVEADDEVYQKRMEVLTLESAYKKSEINVEKWVSAFNSARKLANLKIAEMGALNDGVRGRGRE